MSDSVLTGNPALLDHWYMVAEGADLGAGPLGVTLLGHDYVVWRTPDGSVAAAPDRCPHREAPLSLGRVDGGCLVCPYHGWTFGTAPGASSCRRRRPGAGAADGPPAGDRHRGALRPRVALPGHADGGDPAVAQEDDPAYRRINSGVDRWTTSALRMTDNFLDIAHFPFVHAGTLGGAAGTQVPKFEIVALDDEFTGYSYDVAVANDRGPAASGLAADVVERRMTTGFHLPFTVRSTIHYETGLDHIILLLTTPVDDVRSYFTFVIWRNDDHAVPAEEVIAFDRAIGAEDKRMLEQVPGVLPLDPLGTVSVQADRASVEWRRRLAALLAG